MCGVFWCFCRADNSVLIWDVERIGYENSTYGDRKQDQSSTYKAVYEFGMYNSKVKL